MSSAEVPLSGGRTTRGVVRVDDTVRRPSGPHSPFVRALLLELERTSFAGAPRYLGTDVAARDVLTYLPGEVPAELGWFGEPAFVAAARLLRAFHDSTAGSPLRGDAEVVCHGDPSPCNAVFQRGLPVAFIDFDAAHPGARREDVGYAAWLWLDLGNHDLASDVQGPRLASFLRAYGALPPAEAVPAILDAQAALATRPGAPDAVRAWAQACRSWVLAHADALAHEKTQNHLECPDRRSNGSPPW